MKYACTVLLSLGLAACGARNTASNVEAPGAPAGVSTRVLDAGADALQARPPITALNAYLDGFHFWPTRRERSTVHHRRRPLHARRIAHQ